MTECKSSIHLYGHLIHCSLPKEEHKYGEKWHSFESFRPNHIDMIKIMWSDFQ